MVAKTLSLNGLKKILHVTFSVHADLFSDNVEQQKYALCMIQSHGTKSHMLVRKLHSGTSKTMQLVPVHLDLPLFWKCHCTTCWWFCAMWPHRAKGLSTNPYALTGSQAAQAHNVRSDLFFHFYANVQRHMAYYITTNLTSRNVTLALQHMEVLCYNGLNLKRLVWERNSFAWSLLFLHFVNKIFLPCCRFV